MCFWETATHIPSWQYNVTMLVVQIEELQAQESELRSADTEEGQGHRPISALLMQLGSSTPEETQEALQELLQAAAAAK